MPALNLNVKLFVACFLYIEKEKERERDGDGDVCCNICKSLIVKT